MTARHVNRWAGERVGLVALICCVGGSVYAHHSVLAYDGTTPTTITGSVVKVLWQNPHAYIDLDVATNGTRVRWIIENEGPVALERLGWTKATLAPGDVITITGARARDAAPRMRCSTITLADGRRLPCFANGGT